MNSITMKNQGPMRFAMDHLRARLSDAIVRAFGVQSDPQITYTANPTFGDLQSNIALLLSKTMEPKPRQIAEKIVAHMSADDVCEQPTVAGPGFINFKLTTSWLQKAVAEAYADERLAVASANPKRKIVVDMSSPNIAKEMHVGHLRSTIIGESLARLLSFLGHDVVKINHVGDWGTQFGMLIAELKEKHPQALTEPGSLNLGDIVAFYKQAKKHFDEDEAFQTAARQEVVNLQSGDADSLLAWKLLCDMSRVAFQRIYDELGVHDLIEQGESFYNPQLGGVVKDLIALGVAVESEGAVCVFLDGFTNREGQPLPLIVQKQDGGYNYATTDLAALRHRVQTDGADDVIYVVDAGQSIHLNMVAQAARKAGWVPEEVTVEHVPFGLVCGPDGKKLKTRSGETVRLQDLIDEAVAHAHKQLVSRLAEKGQTESAEWIDNTARAIGIGAVKYNDLRLDRTSNYKFELSKMLSLQGNTAPFMMYSYTRVQSIIREGGIDMAALSSETDIVLGEPLEVELAKHLLQFNDALQAAVEQLMPSRLCEYLFELAQRFNRFYHEHQVLDAGEPQRTSRLKLCDLTARTLKLGLNLLSIPSVDKM
jgi:arginyl-tRNA synthetase